MAVGPTRSFTMPVRPVRSAAKRASVFLAMTYSTPNGRKRPRRSCKSDTLRPRYSVSTAISARPSLSTSPSMAESFSARARTLLLAKGDYLLSVHEKGLRPQRVEGQPRAYAKAVVASAGGWLDPALRLPDGSTGGLRLLDCREVYVSALASANV